MIAFIKRHKWWFIGGGLAVLLYYLYQKYQANAAANANSLASVPSYPTVIYGGGGGGVAAGSSVGTGTTGASTTGAAAGAATVPAPLGAPALLGGPSIAPSGVTGSAPPAPTGGAGQGDAGSYLRYENYLYTQPQSSPGQTAGLSYSAWGGNLQDPQYLADVQRGTIAGTSPYSAAQIAAWSQRAPAVPLDTPFQNGGLGFGGSPTVLSGNTGATTTPASPVTATVPSPDQATPAPIIDTYHLPLMSTLVPTAPGGTQNRQVLA